MPLSADVLLDRMKLKNQLHLWRGLTLILCFLVIWVLIGNPGESLSRGDHIARVKISGFIAEDPEKIASLKKIENDNSIKAVIVRVNSPGGTIVGGENYFSTLKKIGMKKPVVVVMGSLATSAAYMVSLPADYIVAHKGTVTGSIGVLFQAPEVVNLAKKLGVNMTTIKSGPLKAQPSPFEKASPQAIAVTQEVIEDFHSVFVEMVAESRKLPIEKVRRLADGRIYSARQAKKNKLVDAIGDEESAVTWLKESKGISSDLKVYDFSLEPPKNDIGKMFKGMFVPNFLEFKQFTQGGLLSYY